MDLSSDFFGFLAALQTLYWALASVMGSALYSPRYGVSGDSTFVSCGSTSTSAFHFLYCLRYKLSSQSLTRVMTVTLAVRVVTLYVSSSFNVAWLCAIGGMPAGSRMRLSNGGIFDRNRSIQCFYLGVSRFWVSRFISSGLRCALSLVIYILNIHSRQLE